MAETLFTVMRASASGVLGEYDHQISLDPTQRFVILYGPNGVGKTKFLEIIDSLSHLSAYKLSSLPFTSAELQYSDGSRLSVRREMRALGGDTAGEGSCSVEFILERPNFESISWNYEDDGFHDWLNSHTPYEQVAETIWQDPSDGEIVTTEELRSRYQVRQRRLNREAKRAPEMMLDFVSKVPTFLIETQRLRIELSTLQGTHREFGLPRQAKGPRSRINEQASQIRNLVNAAQTEHSRITQQLDRTFPNRVLSANSKIKRPDPDTIRARYNEQNDFRSRLGRIASVALEDELSLPEGLLQEWALNLLKLYLDDADQKFAPFVGLLNKIELLEQIVNEHLLNKRLQVTDGEGLSVSHLITGRPIKLDSLSSGEQHEIILMIDLLFNVPAGALVLIDEPEISLHVAWQLAFIPDVQRVAELSNFRFVVATHSPQIINDSWHQAYRLGPPGAEFE